MGVQVVVALGSNLGDRREHLRAGVRMLDRVLSVERVSRVMETPPWGDPHQGPFLNLVLVGRTAMSSREAMDALLDVERRRGRKRTRPGGPRTLDADLIFHGAAVLQEPGLILPHPRWHLRTFVVLPLLEVLPDGVDPVTGRPLADRVAEQVFRGSHRDAGPLEGWGTVGAVGSRVATEPIGATGPAGGSG
jgi:2-amino-4-hydroxy-6-hydroxymethyldihydropteridine diphosphokinase